MTFLFNRFTKDKLVIATKDSKVLLLCNETKSREISQVKHLNGQ